MHSLPRNVQIMLNLLDRSKQARQIPSGVPDRTQASDRKLVHADTSVSGRLHTRASIKPLKPPGPRTPPRVAPRPPYRAIAGIGGCLVLALSGCGGGSSGSSPGSSGTSSGGGVPTTYRLSGAVGGLNGDGLTMDVNGSTINVPSGSTTVALASGLSSGAAYSVTVASQPSGETCTITNGSGTVGSADVTNIAVACVDDTYVLGGTVSALTQPGLVLANGTDTATVAVSANTFTMPTKVSYGGSYDVTVQTQPSGETCAVSRGSGTMPAGDVNSIGVTCLANTFTVGGSITGLAGSGLVLLDNGSDSTPIAANATQFTMNTSLTYGSGYLVTVGTQPAGEICTIGSGSGTLAGAVTDVKIGCAPVLHEFAGGTVDGAGPLAGLVQASDGNFYGTTQVGGAGGAGTVFKLTPAGTETVLHSFTDSQTDGGRPQGSLIQGKDGNLYGTTFNGGIGGTVFKITLTGSDSESLVNDFSGNNVGTDPITLIQASDGNFYGTAFNGGAYGYGTIFKLTPAGTLTALYAFTDSSGDGAHPYALIQASDGNFYGTTNYGGTDGYGTVFKLTPGGIETVLYSFTDTGDGAYPATLIQGSDGNFYGASNVDYGPPQGHGTIFKITPAGMLTVLHTFNGGAGGGNPTDLIQASNGTFYGSTYVGGIYDQGVVFRMKPDGALSVIDSFTGGSDGSVVTDLIQGSDGNLYGTTSFGGTANSPNGYGTAFEMIPQ